MASHHPITPNFTSITPLDFSSRFSAELPQTVYTCTDSYRPGSLSTLAPRSGFRICGFHAPALMLGASPSLGNGGSETTPSSAPVIAHFLGGLHFSIEGLPFTVGLQYEQSDTAQRGMMRQVGAFALLEHNEAPHAFPGKLFPRTFGAGLSLGSVRVQTPNLQLEGAAASIQTYRDWWNASVVLQGLGVTLGVRRVWNTTLIFGNNIGEANTRFREFIRSPETSWVAMYLNIDWERDSTPALAQRLTRGQAVSTINYFVARQLASLISAPESEGRNQEWILASAEARLGLGLRNLFYAGLDGFEAASQSQDLTRLGTDVDYRGAVHRTLGIAAAFRTIDFFTRATPGAVSQFIPSGVQWLTTALRMESALAGRRPNAAVDADWLRRIPVRVGLIVAGAACAGGLAFAQSQLAERGTNETTLELLNGGVNGCMQLSMMGVSP